MSMGIIQLSHQRTQHKVAIPRQRIAMAFLDVYYIPRGQPVPHSSHG